MVICTGRSKSDNSYSTISADQRSLPPCSSYFSSLRVLENSCPTLGTTKNHHDLDQPCCCASEVTEADVSLAWPQSFSRCSLIGQTSGEDSRWCEITVKLDTRTEALQIMLCL